MARAVAVLCALVVGSSVSGQSSIENDACQDAIDITDGTYQGTTTGATVDGASAGCPTGQGPDVWYLYTATCDGLLEVDTCTSPYDTHLSIQYPGCGGVERACNEDACGPVEAPWQSRVQVPEVAAGESFLIRVSGWNQESGDFELRVSCTPGPILDPVADHCEDAVELDVPSSVIGTTEGADYDRAADLSVLGLPRGPFTPEGLACGRTDQDHFKFIHPPGVWYRVVGTGNLMTATTENPGTTIDHPLHVFCDSCERPICVAGTNHHETVTWCTRPGQVYLIWVRTRRNYDEGVFELSVAEGGPCYGAIDCAPVEVVDTFVADNGDADGWPDTHETVNLGFSVTNRSATEVTGLVAHLNPDDDRVACVAERDVYVGTLAPGETRVVPNGFAFRVGEADRTTATATENDAFAAAFRVSMTSDQFADLSPGFSQPGTTETTTSRCSVTGAPCRTHDDCTGTNVCDQRRCAITGRTCRIHEDCSLDGGDYCIGRCSLSQLPCAEASGLTCESVLDYCVDESQPLYLDLDLDAAGGSGPTVFHEDFESAGFGSFSGDLADNLDHGRASLEQSDGYRCQYADPDNSGLNPGARETCFLGANAPHADAYFWQVYDRRSFSGLRSLYFGEEIAPGEFRSPANHLEAIRTTDPIRLGYAVCSVSTDTVCALDDDCPSGEVCREVTPELSFKHQVSLMDDRYQNCGGHMSLVHGVVQVQLAGADGAPIGPWTTIDPKVNRYDSRPAPNIYAICYFDPVDDGNTEDTLFGYYDSDPPVGLIEDRYASVRGSYVTHAADTDLLGPSSNCFPRMVFASAGDTDEPFDPTNLNGPVTGPGLRGASGPGTWVEPRFSLDRYRGRSIRLRFLSSGWQIGEYSWTGPGEEDDSVDDGWWIDDVTVTHTLMQPATVSVDDKDNSNLAVDTDGDCVGNSADCFPGDPQLWAVPGEVIALQASHTGGPGGTTTLAWGRPATFGGSSTDVNYVLVVRGPASSCSESSVGTGSTTTHGDTPAPGQLFTFLVQAENGCGRGPLGVDSSDQPRPGCL